MYHWLPFDNMPTVMWEYLVVGVAERKNWFPAKTGVSDYYSPHVILKKESIDYNHHLKFCFGAYVIASDETKPQNSMKSRGRDAIYLWANPNGKGHEVLDLHTRRVITRQNLTEIPMPHSC